MNTNKTERRGRPLGSKSLAEISLADLSAALKNNPTASVIIGTRWAKSLNLTAKAITAAKTPAVGHTTIGEVIDPNN